MAKRIIPLIGLPVILVALYWLEYWLLGARREAARVFDMTLMAWAPVVGHVLYAGLLALLFWWVHVVDKRSKLVAIIYLLAGLLLVLCFPVTRIVTRMYGPAGARLLSSLGTEPLTSPTRGLTFAGAFMAFIGLLGLLPRFGQKVSS